MSFNFYTLVKYFWVIWFVIFVLNYMFTWDIEGLWRIGLTIVMIIVFAVVDQLQEDKKVLVKR